MTIVVNKSKFSIQNDYLSDRGQLYASQEIIHGSNFNYGDHDYQFKLTSATQSLEVLFEEWTELVKKVPKFSFYHQPEWFYSRLQNYKDLKSNIWFVSLYCDNKLISIFPLMYSKIRKFGIKLRTWCIYWDGDMQLNDFIMLPNKVPIDVVSRLAEFLRKQKVKTYDLLFLNNVPNNSTLSQILYSNRPYRSISIYSHNSNYIDCRFEYSENVKHIHSKFKRNLRRNLNKLTKRGRVHFEYVNSPDTLDIAYTQFVNTEAANYKGKLHTALKYDLKQNNFYKQLIQDLGQSGCCSIYSLWLDDKMIAAQLAIKLNDTYHMMKIGYDQIHRDVSPGCLLLNETIKRYSNNPMINNISFITGFKWNDRWAPKSILVFDHYIYAYSVIGMFCYFLEKLKSFLRSIKYKLYYHEEIVKLKP